MGQICKIVYFDEESVTDYVQIIKGGNLEKTTELLSSKEASVDAELSAKAEMSTGGGIAKVFSTLLGLNAGGSAEISTAASLNTNKMMKNILKNTILTDFLNIIDEDNTSRKYKKKGSITKFSGYSISVEKDSLSYIVMVSPYLSMLKGGPGIPAGEFNIAIDKMENALKNAKGYYEFIGKKANSQVVFRFNINSFRNNYRINDLLKMNITIYAINVGKTTLEELNAGNELDIDFAATIKDNPSYEETNDKASKENTDKLLDVYDVLLAGVEVND